MVRLKVNYRTGAELLSDIFQFQNGSIKSSNPHQFLLFFLPFQFQNGSIKKKEPAMFHFLTMIISIPKWFD